MRSNTLKTVILIAAALVMPSFVSAEPHDSQSKIGRLNDGRAYRTDTNGYRITDYLAELEVTVDGLRRQVAALEGELNDKRSAIESFKNTGVVKTKSQLQVTDLTKETNTLATQAGNQQTGCEMMAAPLKSKIAQLEQQVNSRQQNSISANECTRRARYLRTQITELRQALSESPNKGANTTARDSNTQLESTFKKKEAKIASLEHELKQAKEIANLQQKKQEQMVTSPLFANPTADTAKRAAMRSHTRSTQVSKTAQAADMRLVNSAKKKLSKQLAHIQQLIGKRKSLFDRAKSRRTGVTINIASLKTKSGATLDALRLKVKKFKHQSAIPSIESGVSQIEEILNQDILLMTRLADGRKGTKVLR